MYWFGKSSFYKTCIFKYYRIGQPDEMGGIASFLVSDDASYISGENIVAAGGSQSRL